MRKTLAASLIGIALIASPMATFSQMPTYRFSPRPAPRASSFKFNIADPFEKSLAILNELSKDTSLLVRTSDMPSDVPMSAITTILSAYRKWGIDRRISDSNKLKITEIRKNIDSTFPAEDEMRNIVIVDSGTKNLG